MGFLACVLKFVNTDITSSYIRMKMMFGSGFLGNGNDIAQFLRTKNQKPLRPLFRKYHNP